MLGLASLALLLPAVSALVARDTSPAPLIVPNLSSCPATSAYSCENTTAIPDSQTCCTATPGGLQLQTQFWDTNVLLHLLAKYTGRESSGQFLPEKSWTIHGLWPDFCDGTYTQYCDLKRQYDPLPSPNTTNGLANGTVVPPWKGAPISEFLKKFNRYDLLDYMNGFWIAQGQPNSDFWAHEFSKHATCTSTFDPKCYSNYTEGAEVVDFFQAVIRAFKYYPTYDMLAAHNIVPSNTTTYTLTQLTDALRSQTGATPYLGCSGPAASSTDKGRTILSEVWYNTHVLGTPQYGQFKAVNSPANSSCTTTGQITYPLRSTGSEVPKNGS